MMVPTVCCSISLLFFRRIEHLLLPVNNNLLLIRPKAMSHQHLQNNPGLEDIYANLQGEITFGQIRHLKLP